MITDEPVTHDSHRHLAASIIERSGMSTAAETATVHALLAIEDRLDALVYALSNGGDVRRRSADDPQTVAARA